MSKDKTKTARFELILSEEEKKRLKKKAGRKSAAEWVREQINAPIEDSYARELRSINASLEEIKGLLKKKK